MSAEVIGHGANHPDGHASASAALAHHFENLEQQREAGALGMWVFLVTEIMFFGGLFMAYMVYRLWYPEAFAAASHHLDVPLGGVNTAALICSSLTMAMAVHSAQVGNRRSTITYLALTLLLGLVFLAIKFVEYKHKFEEGLVPGPGFKFEPERHFSDAQIFFSLYFAMTGLHALHMVIGVGALSVLIAMAWRGKFSPEYHAPVELSGLYWHFVDIIWIFLFPLLYLVGTHLR
jgi:cytochrome c oxidase subunit 3